ncbi:MAG: TonB-dependent receptor [Siphonobacter sp.]
MLKFLHQLLLGLGCFLSFSVTAQNLTIRGKVTASVNGEVLPGVSIAVKGSTRGTNTNASGEYTLPNVPAGATLVFSSVGYQSQETIIGNRTTIDIVLVGEEKGLDEVVVVGYGTQRKIETTGSIVSVKASDLLQTPVSNVAQGLQARVAGVQINQNTGAPGGNISVRIRGTNSISGSSEPLYIIDGIQISNSGGITDVSPLSTINPNDIESLEVLKDASATAIYGARAANGVVLITTKRGKSGVTHVDFDSYYGIQETRKTLELLNASEFAQLENETFKTTLYADPSSLGQGTNWQKLIFRDAPIQSHQLTINGGSEKTQMAVSLNYFNQYGIIVNSGFKRYSLRLNMDHKVSNKIKIGTSILGTYSINNAAITGSTTIGDQGVISGSILGAAVGAPPTLVPYRSDGSVYPFAEQMDGLYDTGTNPMNFANTLNQTTIKRTLTNVFGEAIILKGLTYRASFNVDLQASLKDYYSPRSLVAEASQNDNSGSGSKANTNNTSLLHESILTYNKIFNQKHSFKVTAVYGTQVELYNYNAISATGFPNDATLNEALQLATTVTASTSRTKARLDSYLGRINYGFKDKIFFDATVRVDGSSKFGANHKYGVFPAASAAWRIIEEPFVKGIKWLSDLKLRGSYGVVGNAGAISTYQSLATVSANGSNYNINNAYVKGINPDGIANPDLRWERSTQIDVGLDIGLFNNRVNIIGDVYYKKTDDLLYVKTLPLSSGYSSITGNFAALENKGIELAINGRILDGPLKWSASGNITINRNKVLDLDGGTTNETFITTYTLLKVGQPLGVFKTYVFDGINQTGETILSGYDGRTGGYKVKDLNGDETITSDDQTIVGNPNPDFIYGFSTNLSYKKFDLSILASGSQGNDIYNAARLSFEMPLGQRNQYKGLVNRWSETNPSNEYVSAYQGGRLPVTNHMLENGSYMRIKNITLGYTLPKLKGVQQMRVYVSGNNLITITKYSGFEPEVNTYAGSNTAIGIDNLVYPQARSILIGLHLSF